MSQCCVKICTPQDMAQSNASRRPQPTTEIGGRQYEPAKNEMEIRRIAIENMKTCLSNQSNPESKITSTQSQGEVGEYHAKCVAVQQLGITLIELDHRAHGIDVIGIDKDGHYCLIESKCTTSRDGLNDLATYPLNYKNGEPVKNEDGKDLIIKQAGLDWTTDRLNRMQIPGDELYSEKNAALASKIQKEFDRQDGSVKRYLVHTNVNTLNVIVNRDHGDGDWQFESAFRCIDE